MSVFSWWATHKILLDVGEVFAVLLQRLLEQVGLGRAPLLHFIPAEDGPTLRHQRRDGPGHVVACGVEGVHRVKLRHEAQIHVSREARYSCFNHLCGV